MFLLRIPVYGRLRLSTHMLPSVQDTSGAAVMSHEPNSWLLTTFRLSSKGAWQQKAGIMQMLAWILEDDGRTGMSSMLNAQMGSCCCCTGKERPSCGSLP